MNKMANFHRTPDLSGCQKGFTLLETLIALGVSLFLVLGLDVIFMSNHAGFLALSKWAQLEDNEIMAMNIIGNVVQSAGYYNNPQGQLISTALAGIAAGTVTTPIGITFSAGQSVFGGNVNGSDVIAVRAYHNNNSGAIDCTGSTAGTDEVISAFSVDASGNLQCTTYDINTATAIAPQTLVTGLSTAAGTPGMVLLYGTDPGSTGYATQYKCASATPCQAINTTSPALILSSDWMTVRSVRVTLNFVNPLAAYPGQPATLAFTKVFSFMGTL